MPATAPEILENCLGFICGALVESGNRRFDEAKRALAAALCSAADMPQAFLPDFRAALLYATLLVQTRQSPTSVTPEIRSKAGALLEQSTACNSVELFQELMFVVLTELGESRRAIPFGERGLAIAVETRQSVGIADWLWKIGGC